MQNNDLKRYKMNMATFLKKMNMATMFVGKYSLYTHNWYAYVNFAL